MQNKQTAVFTLMVDNEFGVLTRITALIRRAGWNIRSLSVGETEMPAISRLTICLECRNNTLEYVIERLGKLNCVREISIFSREDQVAQELAIVRVTPQDKSALNEFCSRENAATLFESGDEMVLSLACGPERMETLLLELREIGRIEVARTGTIAMKLPQGV